MQLVATAWILPALLPVMFFWQYLKPVIFRLKDLRTPGTSVTPIRPTGDANRRSTEVDRSFDGAAGLTGQSYTRCST